jgi:FkbM family methyltransferase
MSELKYYAELSTDKFIRETFFPNENDNMVMAEIGAGTVEFYSMSKHFRDSGWRCVCVDPNPKFVEQHKNAGHEIYEFACSSEDGESIFNVYETGAWIDEYEGISYSSLGQRYDYPQPPTKSFNVKVIKLNNLLESIKVERLDFLSVDVEGWELEVMRGFDVNKYLPKVVLLENLNYDIEYDRYMESVGYSLHTKLDYNYIYTPKTK